MSNPDSQAEILVQGVEEWLARELPGWARRTRFHARRVDGDRIHVLTARDGVNRTPNFPPIRTLIFPPLGGSGLSFLY